MSNLGGNLPALDVKTPAPPPSALAEFGQVAQIQSHLQAQQLQQQQIQENAQKLKNIQATTAAMQNWDPSTGDYDALAKDVIARGGDANAAMAITQHGLQVKQLTANLSKDNLANYQAAHKAVGDAILPLTDPTQVPDEQLHGKALDTVMDLVNKGIMDRGTGQQAIQAIQTTQDPTVLRTQIGQMGKVAQGAAATAAQQKTAAETAAETQKARESAANATLKEIEAKGLQGITPDYIIQTAQDPVTKQQALAALGRGDVEGAKDALKAGFESQLHTQQEVNAATNPQIQAGKVAVAQAEGQARANIEAATARGSDAALAMVPPHLVAPATAAATKAGEDYAQAQSVSQRLQAMMDAAKKGNVVSYQLIPQEGALQVTTSQGVHRINMAEIQNYGGGSLWQRMEGHIGKTLTGESIPDSVLNDMTDMQKIQSEGSQTKYNNTLKTINDTYGAKFKPVSMDEIPRNVAPVNPASVAPSGKAVSLAAAKQLPSMQGKTDEQIKALIQAQGHTVAP